MAVAAGGFVVALSLPMYTCRSGYRFVDHSGAPGGEPSCMVSDVGYRPTSWLPIKITVAVGGVVAAIAILLWRHRGLVAIGLLIAFAALAIPWFITDGYEQTMRGGRPVCCGRVIDREWLRTSVALVGASLGASLMLAGLLRPRGPHGGPIIV
jgi:hypothetical protein